MSGAGHLGLVLVALFAGWFTPSRPPEMTVSEVTVISEAEFAALTQPEPAPEIATDAPAVQPVAPDTEVPQAPTADTAPQTADPEEISAPEDPEQVPDTIPQPIPDALVEDDAPVIDTPATDFDGSSPLADATPAPAPRVAPTPSIAPPPLTELAPEVVENTAPDRDADPVDQVDPEDTAAAPEEASDRIVTEAEETPDIAPATSMRPRTRPVRVAAAEPDPEPQPQPTPEPEPEPEPQSDPLADAVAAAVSEANQSTTDAPTGPPLTGGEKDAFRVAVGRCWTVDTGAQSAGVIVTVAFSLDQSGKVSGDVRQLSASGGDDAAQRSAFERARRAILRCQSNGFPLPAEKYAQWRDIEMTFNPEGMQFR